MENDAVDTEEEYVLVFDAPDQVTAELVFATLQAAGLRAVLQNEFNGPAAGWLTYMGSNYSKGVGVPASEVAAAQSILAAQEPTEDEILAEMEMDGITLEEAEAEGLNEVGSLLS